MSAVKKRLRIGGMTCVNCQSKIEQKLGNAAGVQSVTVDYRTGLGEIIYDPDLIGWRDITAVVERLDYQVLPEEETPGPDLGRSVSLLVIMVSLYVLLQRFGVLNLLVPSQLADSKMGYGMLFVVGLLTSVHCIAMCGGINLSQCIPRVEGEERSGLAVLRPALLYNLGRVISYTAVGFLLGLVGMVLGGGAGTGLSALAQGVIKMLAGALMVIMGLNLLGIFPWLRRIQPRLPRGLAARLGRERAAAGQPLAVGLLNGLMPCGPLQSMQLVALAAGSPLAGALSMLLFSLGTVPLMLGFGSLAAALGRRFSRGVLGVGSVLVVVLGLAMLSQGGSLSGLLLPDRLLALVVVLCVVGVAASIPFDRRRYRAASVAAAVVVVVGVGAAWNNLSQAAGLEGETADTLELVDGVQVVTSTLSPGRYPNITVQAGTPVRWVIDAPEGSINGCNYKMLISDYGIEHEFTQGENIIEFTPTETGTVQYTCWMGMIHGNIFVLDGDGTGAVSQQQEIEVPVPAGYSIPSDQLALAQVTEDENGQRVQTVSIDLTEQGFSPAVIVVEEHTLALWQIHNTLGGTELLVPDYATALELLEGENQLYLYPQASFEVSTGDHQFYAYVKVVEDIGQADETAIRQEVDAFETMIYPDAVFAGAGMSCCS